MSYLSYLSNLSIHLSTHPPTFLSVCLFEYSFHLGRSRLSQGTLLIIIVSFHRSLCNSNGLNPPLKGIRNVCSWGLVNDNSRGEMQMPY